MKLIGQNNDNWNSPKSNKDLIQSENNLQGLLNGLSNST